MVFNSLELLQPCTAPPCPNLLPSHGIPLVLGNSGGPREGSLLDWALGTPALAMLVSVVYAVAPDVSEPETHSLVLSSGFAASGHHADVSG